MLKFIKKPHAASSKFYRSDIDGLRAVSVLAVIFYHANVSFFSGGFAGVDVFFVISGFLISSIILREQQMGTFTLANFYMRRVRRILPAIFTVTIVCIPLAWFILGPRDMKDFAQSVGGVVTFTSNLLFWRESGYFEQSVEYKPLLHTWSLAVEEQFYAIFPLVLMALAALRLKIKFVILACIFFVSFYFSMTYSQSDPGAAFYLIVSRAWQLILGAASALFVLNYTGNISRPVSEVLSIIGFMMVIVSIVIFDANSWDTPALMLIPVVGATLIIIFSKSQMIIGKLLGSKILVALGILSYSAYLWHYPILAFTKYSLTDDLQPIYLSLIGLSSFALAYPTWLLIENLFRDSQRIGDRLLLIIILPIGSGLFLFAILGHMSNGFDFRYNSEEKRIISYLSYSYSSSYNEGKCFMRADQDPAEWAESCILTDGEKVFLWGDSHAAALSSGLRRQWPNLSQMNSSGCPPIANKLFVKRPNCKTFNDEILSVIKKQQPAILILHANWSSYDFTKAELFDTLITLKKLSPASQITILGGSPQWKPDLPRSILKSNMDTSSVEQWLKISNANEILTVDENIKDIGLQASVNFISILDKICIEDRCLALVKGKSGLEPLVWDSSHLTSSGADKLGKIIKNEIAEYGVDSAL